MQTNTPVTRCYWSGAMLIIEASDVSLTLSQTEGLIALKRNSVALAETSGEVPLFEPDTPRRMELIQQQISAPRD